MAETLNKTALAPAPLGEPRLIERPGDWRPVWTHSPAETIDISVCIANWNCVDLLRACLSSLLEQPQGVSLEVIVADNASTDGAPDMVAREFPDVRLIRNSDNRGFARASNQAAEAACGQYLFFLNNDTLVPEFTLARLADFARAHPGFGMIGPRLRDGRGKLQISYRRKPTLKAMLHRASLIRWTGIFRKAYDDYRRDGFEPEGVRRVEVLMGAAVLVPREVYRDCGGWDESFVFGVEDVEYSDRIGRTRPCVHVPGIEIVHYGRVSSRQNVAFAAPNLMIGYARYFRKSGVSRWSLIGYKLVFTLDAPMQFATMCVQYLWRRATGASPTHIGKSRMAAQGIWRFLTRELVRFWKA